MHPERVLSRLRGALTVLALCASLLAPGCRTQEAAGSPVDRGLALACARYNPAMQSAVLEAVFYAGGPMAVDVEGWMCGRSSRGVDVRIVLLRFADVSEPGRRGLGATAPVVFEDGALVSFGWALILKQPHRYGVLLPAPNQPWCAPPGWIAVLSAPESTCE